MRVKHPIIAPQILWKEAARAITARTRRLPAKRRRRQSGSLPWRLLRSKSAEELMWEDYWIFRASGMLHEWFELYKDRLNLKEPLIHAGLQ